MISALPSCFWCHCTCAPRFLSTAQGDPQGVRVLVPHLLLGHHTGRRLCVPGLLGPANSHVFGAYLVHRVVMGGPDPRSAVPVGGTVSFLSRHASPPPSLPPPSPCVSVVVRHQVEERCVIQRLLCHGDAVSSLALDDSACTLVSGSWDCTVKVRQPRLVLVCVCVLMCDWSV